MPRHCSALTRSLCVALVALATSLAAPRAGAGEPFDPWTQVARYEFEYRVALGALPAGNDKRVWIPIPAETAAQRLLSTEVESPWPYRVTTDAFGNRILFAEQSGDRREGNSSDELVARFVVERSPSAGVSVRATASRSRLDPELYLSAQRKIPLEGVIADIAASESRGLGSDSEKIRAFYDYVVRTMTYSKHGAGWGHGDAIWACTEKYGNCTDFHSLFIGMARSQGIPARFVIGFPLSASESESEVDGYHCWAEVYQADRGWFPLDATEAKKSSRIDDYFGSIPSDRIEFTVGRDLTLAPPQRGEPANYFIYPYAEVDGVRVHDVPATFRFIRFPQATHSAGEEVSASQPLG